MRFFLNYRMYAKMGIFRSLRMASHDKSSLIFVIPIVPFVGNELMDLLKTIALNPTGSRACDHRIATYSA
jgi:hypothetical protein